MPDRELINLFNKAAKANESSKYREGSIIKLPDAGRLVMTGDLHGNTRNFERIVTFCDLENNPDTHVILHEILHGGQEDEHGGCLSFHLFAKALNYKLQFPQQVHLIMGNHDTAIITDNDVLKNGKEMNRSLKQSLKRHFPNGYDNVIKALRQCLVSQCLAARTQNRIWISHSLPACRTLEHFDTEIFDRHITEEDCRRPNSAYLLTWGRRHKDETYSKLKEILDADVFLLGHQTQEKGWKREGNNSIILASEHSHGCILPFDLSKSFTIDELTDMIIPLASIA